MHARVSTYEGTNEQLDRLLQGIERVGPHLRELSGFRDAYALVDRASGRAMTVTLWETEQDAEASAEEATKMRNRAAAHSGHTVVDVRTFEVGLHMGGA